LARFPIPDDPVNVFGGELVSCSKDPVTGFYRDGRCNTCAEDIGSHTVCCLMTEDFLAFSKSKGNDLSTPRPEFGFSGLKPGDFWCLCAQRWLEAYPEGKAPKVNLQATHIRALDVVALDFLKSNAIDLH